MGQDGGRDEERPAHRMRVAALLLCRHQVTNAEYDRFRLATGRSAPAVRDKPAFCAGDQPVVAVSWFDAASYCEWLSAQLDGPFHLPTEAEWEWAARGGFERKIYPRGDEPPTWMGETRIRLASFQLPCVQAARDLSGGLRWRERPKSCGKKAQEEALPGRASGLALCRYLFRIARTLSGLTGRLLSGKSS